MSSRRTTLRPLATPASRTVETPAAPSLPSSAGAASGRADSRTLLLAGGLVAIGVIAAGALVLQGARSDAAVAPVPVAAQAAVTTTPACPPLASYLEVMASYERQARWGLAAGTAQTALRTQGLCDLERAALGQKLVTLSREALFEQPPPPEDAPGQRRVATAYADLKTLAGQYGVAPPAPLPVAQSAYDNRLFLLATVAYADALMNGDSTPQDRTVVRTDYAAQYNLGRSWAQRADIAQRQEGLSRLATACRINEQNQLGSPEACNELQMLIGSRARWPAPLADPLISTPSSSSPAAGH